MIDEAANRRNAALMIALLVAAVYFAIRTALMLAQTGLETPALPVHVAGLVATLGGFLALLNKSDPDQRRAFLGNAIIGLPYFWLLALFLVPFLIVLKISLSDVALARPPYMPQLDLSGGWTALMDFLSQLDFENFVFLTSDDLYWKAYLSSLQIALIATFATLLVGYPMAYGMARAPKEWQATLLMLVILPFWTSFLIRVYSLMGILGNEGLLNQFLLWTGLISTPLQILNTKIAVYIGIVYTYLPFMILPIYAALEKMDESLLEAAEDLGCSRLEAFWLVTFPLSRGGIVAGCFLVFIPTIGEFVIPSLLGGSGTLMIGKVLWEEFFNNRDWPVASAVAVILLLILIIPIVLFQRSEERARQAGK
ncbi:ABC transporter permease subunit [Sagittula stellata]|uniref:Putrescine ABC transporter, permease protein n=1 Tax=Sagittula stellata (strain ATCC 700073 / DSM 11524 / E-37) TaxID=388399 RepID=A3K2E8_SAGS3|nr:ABC transporter permease subunit [Sagittula stellata]EBA08357.1 putrescine ABC transporter, permease protein [Sagittula stellata E-37]